MLGLYAMSMNCMQEAENQLTAALRVSLTKGFFIVANATSYDLPDLLIEFIFLLIRLHKNENCGRLQILTLR